MISKISKHRFIKQSKKYGISDDAADAFYDGFEKMLKILKKYNFQWEEISSDDWNKLLAIEEEFQWPALEKLPEYSYEIYRNADAKEKGNVIIFRNSIRDEIILRKNQYIIGRSDYVLGLKQLIRQRFDHLLTIFEVDKASFWKTVVKIALAGGALSAAIYALKKYKNHRNSEKED